MIFCARPTARCPLLAARCPLTPAICRAPAVLRIKLPPMLRRPQFVPAVLSPPPSRNHRNRNNLTACRSLRQSSAHRHANWYTSGPVNHRLSGGDSALRQVRRISSIISTVLAALGLLVAVAVAFLPVGEKLHRRRPTRTDESVGDMGGQEFARVALRILGADCQSERELS